MAISPSSCSIRPALPEDVATIFTLIRALADYEKLSHEVVGNEALLAEHLFGDRPYIEALIAEAEGTPAGFALFFNIYDAASGTLGYYLEDLFVFPEYRGRGIGRALLAGLAQRASAQNYHHLRWSVLDWNEPAIAFYQRIGAEIHADHRVVRLTGDTLAQFLKDDSCVEPPLKIQVVNGHQFNSVLASLSLPQDAGEEWERAIASLTGLTMKHSEHSSTVEVLAVHDTNTLLGWATFTHSYSTFLTRPGLLIETFLVSPTVEQSVEQIILQSLAQLATQRSAGRLEWVVHTDDARAIAQCNALGATLLPDWRICRMNQRAITSCGGASSSHHNRCSETL